MKKTNDKFKFRLVTVFVAFIAAIELLNFITPSREFSDSENRSLEQKPAFSLGKLLSGDFTKSFEKYVADQFPLRDFWISVKAEAEEISGKKENNGVYIGKEGYLFQKFQKPLDKDIKSKLEAINEFSASIPEANKYFMLVPNSIEILKEKLPPQAPVEDQHLYLNKTKELLNKNTKFIDVYDTLYSNREQYIYYKTDHHWTTKGAYYAYEEFGKAAGIKPQSLECFNIKKVTDSFYGTSYSKGGIRNIPGDSINLYIPKTKEKLEVVYSENGKKTASIYDMDSLNQKDKYNVFLQGNHPLVTINTKVNKEKILIVKDSYANSFVPFLTAHFGEIYMVDLRYYEDNLKTLINSEHINNVLLLYNESTFFEDETINSINQ